MIIGKIKVEPAFPSAEWLDTLDPSAVNPMRHQGMTLRDYFAAKAMQGIFDNAIEWFPTGQKADEESLQVFKDIAQDSYALADAMLKARQA